MGEGGYEFERGHEKVTSSHRGGHEKVTPSHRGGHEIVGLLGTNCNYLGQQFKKNFCLAPLGIYNFSILVPYRPQCFDHY